jgi:hypothetical protein
MVLHEHQANPHVHLSVRAESRTGKRLNPRKTDLHRWRETFAEKLRGWGIEAEATRQATRGENRKRLRPTLISTFALVSGMLPVAVGIGECGEFYRPMAVSIIGGTISSTFLTLLGTPSPSSSLFGLFPGCFAHKPAWMLEIG